MEVTVRLNLNHFQTTLGNAVKLEISPKQTIRDVLSLLQKQYPDLIFGDLDRNQRAFLILINGVEISAYENLETEISSSCELLIIPVIHGG